MVVKECPPALRRWSARPWYHVFCDSGLRTLLIRGARSALYAARNKDNPRSLWLQRLKARRGSNIAAVALANKNARIAWVVLRFGETYQPAKAPLIAFSWLGVRALQVLCGRSHSSFNAAIAPFTASNRIFSRQPQGSIRLDERHARRLGTSREALMLRTCIRFITRNFVETLHINPGFTLVADLLV